VLGYVPENRDIFRRADGRAESRSRVKAGRAATRWSMEDTYRLFRCCASAAWRGGRPLGRRAADVDHLPHPNGRPGPHHDPMSRLEGLAPQVVERIAALLHNIAERGISILLVEQKLTIALRISHRLYVMGHGRVVFEGTPADLQTNHTVRQTWLEV